MRIVSLSLIFIVSLGCIPSHAQEKCATVPYMKSLLEKNGLTENDIQFEKWLKQKIDKRKETARNLRSQSQAFTYQVPVVIHVVHNGQPIGGGPNLSDTQLFSQITVLNEDFNRLNADQVNTPAAFAAVAGSFDLEFVLAKSDPEGKPTTGIIRVDGARASWNASSEADMAVLKSKSYWPAENYLNIWVTDLGSNYLGLAQFPVSDLPGLEDFQNGLSETDGVVIDYTAFGVGSSDPTYNLGRSATHEMGHFFGLRHIWNEDDNNCNGAGDYATDTPSQQNSTTICPTGVRTDGCSNTSPGIMYQNFMDYTDDACMNLYTQDQVDRMISVLENSPRRTSLLTSPGLTVLSGLGEDLKITSIEGPVAVTCSSTALKFTIQNLGSPIITKFKVTCTVDDTNSIAESFDNLSIGSGAFHNVTLPITLPAGEHQVYFNVHSPNGYSDVNADNSDTLLIPMVNDNKDIIPLREQFDASSSSDWTVFNPASGTLWTDTETNFNTSSYFKAYDNPQVGERAWLVSPVLDFSSVETASMLFDYSYRYTDDSKNDRLKIHVSTDCGTSFYPLRETPFDKSGQSLSGIKKTTEWFPANESDWTIDQYINLNELAGYSQVRLAFIAENENGNNIFVDNIEFFVSDNPSPFDGEFNLYAIYWVEDGSADITFNLPERQTAGITMLDATGRVMFEAAIPNVLNQTFNVPTGKSPAGLYLIRIYIDGKYYLTKVYLSP